jgi:signal transduction histidine kinase
MTIRARLALIYVAAILVTIGLVGLVVWWQLGAALRSSLDQTLESRATAALTSVENDGQVGLQEGDKAASNGTFLLIYDAHGNLVDASANAPAGLVPPAPGVVTTEAVVGSQAYAIHASTGDTGVRVIAGSSLAPVTATLDRVARSTALVGLIAALASLAGGWWLAGRALRPVALITAEASRIGADDLGRRVPVPSQRDELQALAMTLNGMLDRVAEALRRQRTFVATASHDLRTPISALQAELDLAQDVRTTDPELRDAVRAAHADVVRLGELATALLDLATVEPEGRAVVRQPLPADELVESVVRRVAPLARDRDTRISHAAPRRAARVDRVRLEQALANLVINAIAYGPAGSEVIVNARVDDPATEPHPVLTVEVLDRGTGIPDDLSGRLFEPFERGYETRSPGAGLGLATAAASIRAHRGTIGFEPRPGGGTRFWFTVPA